jgi:hypothetical protein
MADIDVTTFDSTTEEWCDVPEYDGKYQVSNLGRVRVMKKITSPRRKPLIRRPQVNTSGYYSLSLSLNGKRSMASIHSLVAQAFLGERPEGYEVNHIDGNKLNNRVDNLEYCTRSQNIQHALRVGLIPKQAGANNHNAKLTEDDVREIRKTLASGVSIRETSRIFGVSDYPVGQIARGKHWTHLKDDDNAQ